MLAVLANLRKPLANAFLVGFESETELEAIRSAVEGETLLSQLAASLQKGWHPGERSGLYAEEDSVDDDGSAGTRSKDQIEDDDSQFSWKLKKVIWWHLCG